MSKIVTFKLQYFAFLPIKIHSITIHYGRFWEILSQNLDINFYSLGLIFTLFLKILASEAIESVNHLPNFEILEIKIKLHF